MAAKDEDTKAQGDAPGLTTPTEAERERGRDERVTDLIPSHRRRKRSDAPREFTATLIRGLNFRLAYHPHSLVLWAGQPTPITKEEMEYLAASRGSYDFVATFDSEKEGGKMTKRAVPKFAFHSASGEEVDVPVPDFEPSERQGGDAYDRAVEARAAMRAAR